MEEKTLITATICFFIWDNHVCLALKKRKIGAGYLNGYGGGPEPGEKLEDTAIRELHEESGVKARRQGLKKVAVCHFKNQKESGERFTCVVHVFFATDWEGTPKETSEMGHPEWFLKDQVPLDRLMPADPFWLPRVLVGEKIEVFASYGPRQETLLEEVRVRPLTL